MRGTLLVSTLATASTHSSEMAFGSSEIGAAYHPSLSTLPAVPEHQVGDLAPELLRRLSVDSGSGDASSECGSGDPGSGAACACDTEICEPMTCHEEICEPMPMHHFCEWEICHPMDPLPSPPVPPVVVAAPPPPEPLTLSTGAIVAIVFGLLVAFNLFAMVVHALSKPNKAVVSTSTVEDGVKPKFDTPEKPAILLDSFEIEAVSATEAVTVPVAVKKPAVKLDMAEIEGVSKSQKADVKVAVVKKADDAEGEAAPKKKPVMIVPVLED